MTRGGIVLLAGLLSAPLLEARAERPVIQAEHQRISEEMRRLKGRQEWEGVDRLYRQLVVMRGLKPGYADHQLGAAAALELGEVDQAYKRLQQALESDFTDEALEMSARLLAAYGEVDLVLRPSAAGATLEAEELPFDPLPRRTIETAARILAETGRYQGLLPHGRYRLGEIPFEVVGGPEVRIVSR